MQITRAVITAAGRGARQYPASDTVQKAMLPVVDRDGLTKPVLQIIAEEALESGIEEICVVSAPGDEAVYRDHFRNYAANLRSAFKGVEWAEEQARRLFDLEQRRRSHAGSREGRRRGPRPGGTGADLRDHQGCETALGARPGGCLPGRPVREALGRFDLRCPTFPASFSPSAACGDSSSRMRHSLTAGSPTAAEITSNPFALSHDSHGER